MNADQRSNYSKTSFINHYQGISPFKSNWRQQRQQRHIFITRITRWVEQKKTKVGRRRLAARQLENKTLKELGTNSDRINWRSNRRRRSRRRRSVGRRRKHLKHETKREIKLTLKHVKNTYSKTGPGILVGEGGETLETPKTTELKNGTEDVFGIKQGFDLRSFHFLPKPTEKITILPQRSKNQVFSLGLEPLTTQKCSNKADNLAIGPRGYSLINKI